jgi:alkylated DNA repair protein (DNA oxidative demethylase)
MQQPALFDEPAQHGVLRLGPQACVLRGMALPWVAQLLAALQQVEDAAPPRQMLTPGGQAMSVATTGCGTLGWISDRRGYRYSAVDPLSGLAWPAMPACFSALAHRAAEAAGFRDFSPDACLVNHYRPGARLSLHQDRDERDLRAPIVSVSLGMAAVFLFGGLARTDPTQRVGLQHGDVVVWGGVDRLRFHGVLPLRGAAHALLGAERINLTLRLAG